ncbi:MAG: GPP34 family phosphoprotein, partial [Enterobacterales bacterium]|nr:GPP34 family phosphoprotein [Enterobacterales bacterium]
MLSLSEKLLLLGLNDEKGSVVFSASGALPYGLAGALILELYLLEKIDFRDQKVKVINSGKTDNDLLNEVLALLSSSSKRRDTKHWVQKVTSKVKKIQERLAHQLVAKKVLSKQEHSFMWLINYNRYPTDDEQPEKDVRSHVKDVVLRRKEANLEDVALVSLIKACELINEVFDKSERDKAKKRIESMSKNLKIGAAISQTMEELMAAIMIAIIAATVVPTTITLLCSSERLYES